MTSQRRILFDVALALGLCAIAFAVRSLPWRSVFVGNHVLLFPDDPPYQVRRALMTLVVWPRVPSYDPFVNFPFGGTLVWPPGLSWLLAALSRLFGARSPADQLIVERVAVLLPPIVGALTVGVVFVSSKTAIGRGPAALAALLLAALPAHVQYTGLSRCDHHMFEPLVMWLAVCGLARATQLERRGSFAAAVAATSLCLGAAFLL